VTAPFRQLVEQIRTGQPENHQDSTAKSQAERLTEDVFVLLESNATLFRALLVESLVQGPQKDGHELAGLMPLFDSAIAEIQTRYAKAGQSPPIDPAVGVRLGFAMIMGSVLIRDMLFPTPPARDKVLAALQFMITRTLIGPQID